jgi:iron complex transport system permease protein
MKTDIKTKLKSSVWFVPVLFFLSALLLIFSLGVGYYNLGFKQVIEFFLDKTTDPSARGIIMNIRLPRVLSAYFIGAALSASGAAYQGVFKNPLVSPDILGVATGAGVGAALAILLGLSYFFIQSFAFIFGLVAVTLSYFLSINVKFNRKVSMVLAGTMVGALCFSIISMMKYFADTNGELPEITYWLMGSLSKTSMNSLFFSVPIMALGLLGLMLIRNRLNVLTLSDEESKSLGVDPKKNMRFVIISSTLLCSGAVSLGGTIGWVGLMVPHIARGIVGSEYGKLLPVSAMIGGIFLLLIDNMARTLFIMEVPIGLLISFIGAPFFYMLIRKGGLK